MKEKILTNANKKYTKKVSIIGIGYVGAGIAYALMIKDIAHEIVFIDTKTDTVNAEMLDIRHGIPNMGSAKITAGTYEDIKDSDLIIVTAGRNRRVGESRLDLIDDNIKIAQDVASNIKKNYTQGVVLVVANPVDVITYFMDKYLGLPKGKVFGTGCLLDTSRLVNVISDYVDLGVEFITATIIGEHGQHQIPLWSGVQVAQLPIDKYCDEVGLTFDEDIKSQMTQKVLNMGAEIIQGKGKTYYGISTCVCFIADAILNKRTVTASITSVLDGEFGQKDVAVSIPCIIDWNGVKKVLTPPLNEQEKELLFSTIKTMKEILKNVDKKLYSSN